MRPSSAVMSAEPVPPLPDPRWSRASCARCWCLCIGVMLVLALPLSVSSALYSCTDSSGTAVITDSPAQLRGCVPLEASRPAPSERTNPPQEPHPHHSTETGAPGDHQTKTSMFSVPLERIGSLLVVTIQINGARPAKVILDTGASHTILSYAVARDLGLWALHPATSITMQTVGGPVQADVLPITSIGIGGAEVRNSLAAIYDLPDAPAGIEGLLGQSVLSQFEVTLNAEKGELRLRTAK